MINYLWVTLIEKKRNPNTDSKGAEVEKSKVIMKIETEKAY